MCARQSQIGSLFSVFLRVMTCLVSTSWLFSSSVHGTVYFQISVSWGKEITTMLSRSSSRGLGTPKIKITRSGRVGLSFRFYRQQMASKRIMMLTSFDTLSHRFYSGIKYRIYLCFIRASMWLKMKISSLNKNIYIIWNCFVFLFLKSILKES